MKKAFMFPGQGSQKVGMGKAIYDRFASAKAVFEEVDATLNQKLSSLMFEGIDAELMKTENAQPAIMAVSIATLRALEEHTGKKIADLAACVAGHSLGEYTALCAAGAISLSETAKVLRARGLYMAEAAGVNPGAMAAVLSLSVDKIKEILNAADFGGEICVIANDNCPGQIVISGHTKAVDTVSETCKAAGAKVIKLAVSGAFHSPLMAPAAEKMKSVLAGVDLKKPLVSVVSNVTADFVSDPAQIKDLLIRQVTGSVLWTESLRRMEQNGIGAFVEVGNGAVLTGLAKKTVPCAVIQTVNSVESIEGFTL